MVTLPYTGFSAHLAELKRLEWLLSFSSILARVERRVASLSSPFKASAVYDSSTATRCWRSRSHSLASRPSLSLTLLSCVGELHWPFSSFLPASLPSMPSQLSP